MSTQAGLEQPLLQDISKNALRLLICGYIRELKLAQDISNLLELCIKYYQKPLYAIVLDNTKSKVIFVDTSTKNTALVSKNVTSLNSDHEEKVSVNDFGALEKVSICHKRDINVQQLSSTNINKNIKYNAIFKAGGENDNGSTNDCGLILYPSSITPSDFNTFYFKLPQIPFTATDRNDPIYSEKYGLISMAINAHPQDSDTAAHFGNIYYLNINDGKEFTEMKWSMDKLPEPLRFYYHFPGNICLINNNETELFIVNGAINNNECIKQTSIYNIETKEYKILKDNLRSNSFCGITYNYNTNKVYIGGGQGSGPPVYYYDLNKNAYFFDEFMLPENAHRSPVLYLDKGGQIIHIASFDKYIRHEWLDFRANDAKWQIDWTFNEIIYKFKGGWKKEDRSYMSLIDFE